MVIGLNYSKKQDMIIKDVFHDTRLQSIQLKFQTGPSSDHDSAPHHVMATNMIENTSVLLFW